MYSIIVFSKDRPLQLHAYLESLLFYSDVKPENITVLYCKTPNIDYSKVIGTFSKITWVQEGNFYDDLLSLVSTSKDKILFGCDDVVFTNNFSIEFASTVLDKNEQIFGFSFRLGNNIKPLPNQVQYDGEIMIWNWQTTSQLQYNYPWELDCTLYRKQDIQKMLQSHNKKIVNPNYLEGAFAENPLQFISRPLLVCYAKKSQAVVITVNRVQETHLNSVDQTDFTNIYFLNKIYNIDNNKLDIKKIAKLNNKQIHVDSKYFILEKKIKRTLKVIVYPKKMIKKILRCIKIVLRNIKFFCTQSISDNIKENKTEIFDLEKNKYELLSLFANVFLPKIKNADETIYEIIKTKKSICRFGDGEFLLIYSEPIPFQTANTKLSTKLREVITSKNENILIGIGYFYYYPQKYLFLRLRDWLKKYMVETEKKINALLNTTTQYYDTFVTQLYMSCEHYDFDAYFKKIRQIWQERPITIICGETVFKNITHNIFENAESIEYLYAPSLNAFDIYDDLFANAKKIDINRLVIIILGPTATVLAYDLALAGYQALDFGHIAKDYDAYIKKLPNDELKYFYNPD